MTSILKRSDVPLPNTGIVHLGPGAFFRAFGAVYTAEALRAEGGDWGICAVSLRSPDIRDDLAPQDWAYTSVSLAPDGAKYEVIEVITDMLVAPENPGAVLNMMAGPATKIVSMTITEKGYCHNPATGALRIDDPNIEHDLANPDAPKTALGFIVHALNIRREDGLAPFTVLSCDNLPDNGALTKNVVLAFARAFDGDLADWIEAEGRFPATMVDRITPATTESDIKALENAEGYVDRGCVQHEPFRQWVIEDEFVGDDHPAWDKAGAQFVSDVAAFETMKLRCLNGTHSTLAYLGYLAGHQTITETVSDPVFAELLDQIWSKEIIPTVPQPEGEDLEAYWAALKARYLNKSIRHRTWQIAMDGSQKLPQRLLGTISDNLEAERPVPGLALAVAAWMKYIGGVDEKGVAIDVKDPMADRLRKISESAPTSAEKVLALLAIEDIFDPLLAANPNFRDVVISAYENIEKCGARGAANALTRVE